MAARSLDFHPEAALEISSSIKWYMEQSETAADGFIAELNGRLIAVLEDPYRFANYLHRTRYALFDRYPYLIVFKVYGALVRIYAVAHTSRRPGYWANRRFDMEAS